MNQSWRFMFWYITPIRRKSNDVFGPACFLRRLDFLFLIISSPLFLLKLHRVYNYSLVTSYYMYTAFKFQLSDERKLQTSSARVKINL
jgi:hypothetical protein